MSNFLVNSPAVVIVAIAGFFAITALIVAKFCSLTHKTAEANHNTAYECGFESTKLYNFITEKNKAISLYLILELAFVWMLSCVATAIACSELCSKNIVNFLALMCLFILMLSTKYVFCTIPR